jgi:hypothetical protein
MLFLGVFEGISYAVTSLIYDEEIPTLKMCTHQSFQDHLIVHEYLVRFLFNLLYIMQQVGIVLNEFILTCPKVSSFYMELM